MIDYYVNVIFKCKWQFKDYPHLKVTDCKKIINEKTGKILKYNQRGFFIAGKYLKRNEINKHLKKINYENQIIRQQLLQQRGFN
jgi:hypothetical protein